jgi:hypothetical protein
MLIISPSSISRQPRKCGSSVTQHPMGLHDLLQRQFYLSHNGIIQITALLRAYGLLVQPLLHICYCYAFTDEETCNKMFPYFMLCDSLFEHNLSLHERCLCITNHTWPAQSMYAQCNIIFHNEHLIKTKLWTQNLHSYHAVPLYSLHTEHAMMIWRDHTYLSFTLRICVWKWMIFW